MGRHSCENCSFRARYDRAPKSLLVSGASGGGTRSGAPGWRGSMLSLPAEERRERAVRYDIGKYL